MNKRILFVVTTICVGASLWAQRNPYNNPVVSPQIAEDGRQVTFSVEAPHAKEILLEGQFMKGTRPMTRQEGGVWSATVQIEQPDIYPYSFIVDGTKISDPSNVAVFPNERFKASLLEMPCKEALYTVRDVPHGKVSYHTYKSSVLGMDRPLLVYTPAGYEKGDKRYPVFYLISGTTDTEETWFKVGRANVILDNLIAEGKTKEMVVVMPYGNMMNGTPMPSSMEAAKMYTVFANELTQCIMPYVEQNYRVKNDRHDRAIAGFSRGGGQALFTALRHLDLFGNLASYSAYLTPQVMDAYFAPLFAADAMPLHRRLDFLWFGVGNEDFLYQDVLRHFDYFDKKGIAYEKLITGGGHTWMNARHYLAETLQRFFNAK